MENVQELGLIEMSQNEKKEIDGGVFGIDDLILTVAAGAILAVINDWDNFEKGFTGQPY